MGEYTIKGTAGSKAPLNSFFTVSHQRNNKSVKGSHCVSLFSLNVEKSEPEKMIRSFFKQ